MHLDSALRTARASGRRLVVPYLLVDRRRGARLAATVAAVVQGGATAVELGFPFSDPIADGPVLAAAADRALRSGTGWHDLLGAARAASARVPTAVMTYANPVLRHGLPEALRQLADAGVSGLIVPDLSLEEAGPWASATRRVGIALVLLATPAASPERTAAIARRSRGFLYLVSRYGTTGRTGPSTSAELAPLVAAAHRAAPARPVLVGFGVRDAASAARAVASGADGVVVGSAIEERIAAGASATSLTRFVAAIAGR